MACDYRKNNGPPSLSSCLLCLLFPPIRLQGQVFLVLSDASFPIPLTDLHAGFDDTEGGNGPWSLFPPGSYKKCPSPATSRLVLLVYGPDGGGCDEESTRAASGLQSGLPSFLSFPTPLGIFPLSTLFFSPACFFLFGCDLVGLPCRRLTPLLHTLTDSYIPTSGFRRPSRKSSEGQWKASKASFFPSSLPSCPPPCAIAAASPTLGRWWPLSLPPGARVTSLSGRSHDNAQRTWT
ncbi:hypothetical protein ASPTUDRAFT_58372 [Aspergillus tubingensis CBS 134.48]|uniref:Uncharacterized protein n=1 Tax=Aspergillus tubingensis (strain CBS 134.48) TaxID=767770 RepID=A0A1L9MVG9_ASPTC|nr:hypothetical protein ASPTUDRAFT_58372 [Aspergillus tubingensis CBS 134.48]